MTKKEPKRHWIGNHLAQASIIFMMGICFLAVGKTGNTGYLISIPGSMFVGMIIASMTPKEL